MILAELEDDPRWERANPRSGDTLAKLAAAPTEYHAGKKNPRTRSRNIVKSPTTAEFRKSFFALPKQVHSSLHARHIASSRKTQVIQVCVSKKCIQSYEFTLLELATIIEPLVSWMEIMCSGFELVHTQSTTSCYLSYNSAA